MEYPFSPNWVSMLSVLTLITGLIGISAPTSRADDNPAPLVSAPAPDGIRGAENGPSGLKTDQELTVTAASPMTAVFGSTFRVAATASSDLAVTITSSSACMGLGHNSDHRASREVVGPHSGPYKIAALS